VKPWETIFQIARINDITIKELRNLNSGLNENPEIGDTIFLDGQSFDNEQDIEGNSKTNIVKQGSPYLPLQRPTV
jgi:hypothetical protein